VTLVDSAVMSCLSSSRVVESPMAAGCERGAAAPPENRGGWLVGDLGGGWRAVVAQRKVRRRRVTASPARLRRRRRGQGLGGDADGDLRWRKGRDGWEKSGTGEGYGSEYQRG
jgi:hypothetical protein